MQNHHSFLFQIKKKIVLAVYGAKLIMINILLMKVNHRKIGEKVILPSRYSHSPNEHSKYTNY